MHFALDADSALCTFIGMNEIVAALERHKLTHRELAERLGYSRTQVTRMANGQQPINARVVKLLASLDHDTPPSSLPAPSPEAAP